jgi:hypothetical protein
MPFASIGKATTGFGCGIRPDENGILKPISSTLVKLYKKRAGKFSFPKPFLSVFSPKPSRMKSLDRTDLPSGGVDNPDFT